MTTKADRVRSWLKHSNLSSKEIAETVGCHPGFVRAIKQRVEKPEREIERHRRYYRENFNGRRDKALERHRRLWREDPEFRKAQAENKRKWRARKRAEAEARA